MARKVDGKAFKRSFFASLGRLIGVGLGAGAGGLLKEMIGPGFRGWGIAAAMAVVSFLLIWASEYEREIL